MRQLDGTVAEFWAVEDALAGTGGVDLDAALRAWTASCVAAGALRIRIDSSGEAAGSWLRAIPSAEAERAAELDQQLGVVTASLDARWQALTKVMNDAGAGLATRVAKNDRRRSRSRIDAAPKPMRPAAAEAVAVPIAVGASRRVVFRVAAQVREPALPKVTSTARQQTVPATAPTATAPPAAPATRRTRTRQSPGAATPAQAGPQPIGAQNAEKVVAALRESARPAPATAGSGARRRGVATAALVAMFALVLAGAMLAGGIGPFARDSGEVADGGAEVPAGAGDASASPARPDIPRPTLVTVDLHPIGPLDPEELPIARIIGAPEVVAFPTPFDRSLRLSGTAAGFCVALASPSTGGASKMAFDLYLGEFEGVGTLAFALPPKDAASATGLGLDLAALAELDREAWYRLAVTGGRERGRLEVTPVGDARPEFAAELGADATILPIPTDEVCIQSSLQSSEASLLVDNLRVDR